MLINKPRQAGDIVSLKTVSGDELVCKLESETDTHYHVITPMVLAHTPQGLGLVPYMFTVDPGSVVMIDKRAVVTIINTHADMAKDYLSKVTGIAL